MKIQKKFQGKIPENKILNTHSESQTDTYSCHKINELISNVGEGGGSGSNIANNVYSEEEIVIGTYFGKPLYRKVLKINALPSTTNETMYQHGIKDLDIMTNMYGMGYLDQGYGSIYQMTLPAINVFDLSRCVAISRSTTGNIAIQCGVDRSAWSADIILEYTKTTD